MSARMSMKFYVATFGCRSNQAEGDALADELASFGHEPVDDPDEAGFMVVNSCTVTHRADHDVRNMVRRLARKSPPAGVMVMGCYGQRSPGDFSREPGVAIVAGTEWRARVPELLVHLSRVSAGDGPPLPDADPGRNGAASPPGVAGSWHAPVAVAHRFRTRPFVKVQDGCDGACSYCVVPSVRGVGRSTPPEQVLEAVRREVSRGAWEILLTGIHLGRYGTKFQPPFPLWKLVRLLLRETDVRRIRLSSIEPQEFDGSLLEIVGSEARLAPHFHVPLQSASPGVLRRMNRTCQPSQYSELVERLAALRPLASLGADVISGFPGESEAEFEETVKFIRESPLTYLHVFPYSPRSGTVAAGMPGRLGQEVAHRRSSTLRREGARKLREFHSSLSGRPLPGLVIRSDPGCRSSRVLTSNYVDVRVRDVSLQPNTPVWVAVEALDDRGGCVGSLVEEPPDTFV